MTTRTIRKNLIINALAEADLVDGEDGVKVIPDYKPKFTSETCFGMTFNTTGDSYHFVVQLAFQLQAYDSQFGDLVAADLAREASVDGPVLYFPGWTLEG